MSKILEKIKGWFYREKVYRNSVRVRRILFFKTITEIYPRPESLTEQLSKSLHHRLSKSLGEYLDERLRNSLGCSLQKSLNDSLGERLGASLSETIGENLGKRIEKQLQDLNRQNTQKPEPKPQSRWFKEEQIYNQLLTRYKNTPPLDAAAA